MNVIARATCVALVLIVLSFSAIAAEQTPIIATKGDVTTVTLPTGWTVVGVQRHAMPLDLPESKQVSSYRGQREYSYPYGTYRGGGDAANALAVYMNTASARLSLTYTITFKTPIGYEVWTKVLPGTVRFVF